jgi:glutathione peroxidase
MASTGIGLELSFPSVNSCSSHLAISYHPDNIRRKNVRKLVSTLVLCLSLAITALAAPNAKVYNYTLKSIDGNPTSLSQFHGKVLFLVNVASSCGYTPQYKALEAVYEKYKDRGLVIVGIPANNFANQESGTDAEIKTFCSKKYNVTFPMMSKVSVKGADQTPLYKYLTDKTVNPTIGGDIKWNFTKFIFDRNGKPVARFEPATTPDSPEVIEAIESALKQ